MVALALAGVAVQSWQCTKLSAQAVRVTISKHICLSLFAVGMKRAGEQQSGEAQIKHSKFDNGKLSFGVFNGH